VDNEKLSRIRQEAIHAALVDIEKEKTAMAEKKDDGGPSYIDGDVPAGPDPLREQGGPAYPVMWDFKGERVAVAGFSKREAYALAALGGIATRWGGTIGDIDEVACERTARAAFKIADAMIMESKR
jgi:hypothetical protein